MKRSHLSENLCCWGFLLNFKKLAKFKTNIKVCKNVGEGFRFITKLGFFCWFFFVVWLGFFYKYTVLCRASGCPSIHSLWPWLQQQVEKAGEGAPAPACGWQSPLLIKLFLARFLASGWGCCSWRREEAVQTWAVTIDSASEPENSFIYLLI